MPPGDVALSSGGFYNRKHSRVVHIWLSDAEYELLDRARATRAGMNRRSMP